MLEFSDPGFGRVHFLTVACFMIQHQCYSDAGLAWIHQTLKTYLDEDLNSDQLRRLAASSADNRQRSWKINRSPLAPVLPAIPWSMTIAVLAAEYQDADSYCELVRQ